MILQPRHLNSSPLKNDGWKMHFLLGLPKFLGCNDPGKCDIHKVTNPTSPKHLRHLFQLITSIDPTPRL